MRRPWFPCVVALSLTGCGDDSVSPSDGTGSGTTSGTTTDPDLSTTSVGPGTAMTEAEGGSDTSETGEAPEPIEYARGVRLDRLTANQATQVQLAVESVSVAPEDYNTRMISGRRTMVRAFWTLHAEFEPRELLGVLTVTYADGSQVLHEQLQHVEGESSDGGGSQSFQWLLAADDVMPGMTLRARLEEPDPDSAGGEVSDPPPVAPLDGPVEVELYDVPLQLKVVLVPILHQFENCEAMPEITEQDIDDMRMQLEQNNAVQEAIFTVREPLPYTVTIGEGGGFSPILVELAATRAADAPEDNVYYYGLIEPCDGYPPGLLGQALGIPAATRENAGQRVSTGRWNGSGAGAMETFVHESTLR